MPGMMDTVLNLGLNDATAAGLAKHTNDSRFAYDSYRRLIQMYGDVVMDVDHGLFEDALEDMKRDRGVINDTDLTGDDMMALVHIYQVSLWTRWKCRFPKTMGTLWGAIGGCVHQLDEY